MKLLNRLGGALGFGGAPGVSGVDRRANYMRGGNHAVFKSWRPALRSNQSSIAVAWDQAAARAYDAIVNSGWLSGAIEQAVANTVGQGVRVRPAPENRLFGQDEAWARDWSRDVSAKFDLWTNSPGLCDVQRKRTLYQMQRDGFNDWIPTGEILAEIPYRSNGIYPLGTRFRLLSATRLSRGSDVSQRLINGVFVDIDGAPVAYNFKGRPATRDVEAFADYRVDAADAYGRPRVCHTFSGRPETFRGVGCLTPVLQVVRQYDQLADGTLAASLLQTVFAAVVQSTAPTEEVLEGLMTREEQIRIGRGEMSKAEAFLDATGGYYEGSPIDVGTSGRIAHLFPGDEMKFLSSQTAGPDYQRFAAGLQREIARCLGVTYESATGDYAGATYYSLGKSNDEIFAISEKRRGDIVGPVTSAIYGAWLEEAIEVGYVDFPGGIEAFHANREAASRCTLHGPPKPIADLLKEMKALETARRCGWMPDSYITQRFGYDYEDVCQAMQNDASMRGEYGLPEPVFMNAGGGGPTSAADETETDNNGGGDG